MSSSADRPNVSLPPMTQKPRPTVAMAATAHPTTCGRDSGRTPSATPVITTASNRFDRSVRKPRLVQIAPIQSPSWLLVSAATYRISPSQPIAANAAAPNRPVFVNFVMGPPITVI